MRGHNIYRATLCDTQYVCHNKKRQVSRGHGTKKNFNFEHVCVMCSLRYDSIDGGEGAVKYNRPTISIRGQENGEYGLCFDTGERES